MINMCNLKDAQKGFSLVEGLLVIMALSLMIIAGVYVYDRSNTSLEETASISSQLSNPEAERSEVDSQNNITKNRLSNDWLVLEADDYLMKIPDGWELNNYEGVVYPSVYPFVDVANCPESVEKCGYLEYVEGKKAEVYDAVGGRDGYFEFIFFGYTRNSDADRTDLYKNSSEYYRSMSTDLTLSGAEVNVYSIDEPREMDISSIKYVIEYDTGEIFEANFARFEVDSEKLLLTDDKIVLIEEMLSTLGVK